MDIIEWTYPFFGVQVETLHLPVLEERAKPDAVIRDVWLLAYDGDAVFPLDIALHEFFSGGLLVWLFSTVWWALRGLVHECDGDHAEADDYDPLPGRAVGYPVCVPNGTIGAVGMLREGMGGLVTVSKVDHVGDVYFFPLWNMATR